MPKKSRGARLAPPSFYGNAFNKETLTSLISRARPLLEFINQNKPFAPETDHLISDAEIKTVVNTTLKHLPAYLKTAKRRRASKNELDDIRHDLAVFLDQQFRRPNLNSDLIISNSEFARLNARRASAALDNFFVTIDGKVDLGLLEIGDTREGDKSDAAKIALVVDLALEIIGLVLGIIGIKPPKTNTDVLVKTFEKSWRNPAFVEAYKKLLEGLKAKNWRAILEWLDYLEQAGNLSEILAHIFAGLHWYDYLITIAKIIAWIVAATASGGAALAAKLVALGLDIAGILIKLPELDAV